MIIKVYVDESGTHGGSDHMLLAGYIGKLGRCNLFDELWMRRLKREGLTYFHAVEHLRKHRYQNMGYDLLKLCGKYLACGFVIRLDKRSYEDFYIGNYRPPKAQLDTMYGVCFRHLLSFLLNDLPKILQRTDLTINILLEDGAKGSKDAFRIHRQVSKVFPELASMLGMISLSAKKQYPGLQAADSLAHPAHREERSGGLDLRPYPEPATLASARRATIDTAIAPVFRIHLDQTVLADMKQTMIDRLRLQQEYAAALAAEA